MNQREILENIYKESFYEYSKGNLNSSLGDDIKNMIMLLAQNAENAKDCTDNTTNSKNI